MAECALARPDTNLTQLTIDTALVSQPTFLLLLNISLHAELSTPELFIETSMSAVCGDIATSDARTHWAISSVHASDLVLL